MTLKKKTGIQQFIKSLDRKTKRHIYCPDIIQMKLPALELLPVKRSYRSAGPLVIKIFPRMHFSLFHHYQKSIFQLAGTPRTITGTHRTVAGTPRMITGTPRKVAEPTRIVATPPRKVAGTPRMIAGTPRTITGTPRTIAGTPGMIAGTPRTIAGTPRMIAGTPRKVAGTPRTIAGTPRQFAEGSRKIAEPIRMISTLPRKPVELPRQLATSPRQLSKLPQQEFRYPRIIFWNHLHTYQPQFLKNKHTFFRNVEHSRTISAFFPIDIYKKSRKIDHHSINEIIYISKELHHTALDLVTKKIKKGETQIDIEKIETTVTQNISRCLVQTMEKTINQRLEKHLAFNSRETSELTENIYSRLLNRIVLEKERSVY